MIGTIIPCSCNIFVIHVNSSAMTLWWSLNSVILIGDELPVFLIDLNVVII